VLTALSHQIYPYIKLVEDLNASRNTGRSPLFDVMVDLQNAEIKNEEGPEELEGVVVRGFEAELTSSKFDLHFSFKETEEGLQVSINYNSDLFESGRISVMFNHIRNFFVSVVSDPSVRISRANYLSVEEVDQLVRGFNRTTVGRSEGVLLYELFEHQVSLHGDSVAVVCGQKSLTYAELNERSDRLASYLRSEYGVGPNESIGLYLSRSEWMVVAILGILKSGASFVPIDTSFPTQRISYMLSDAGVRVLITESEFLFSLIEYYGGEILALDVQYDSLPSDSKSGGRLPESSDLAYVIYTSGSTGHPKGVMISHGSIVNYLLWANDYYFKNRSGYDFAFFTSISFDLTLTSLFTTLLRGDRVRLFAEGEISETLIEIFGESTLVQAVKLTPSHVNLLEYLPIERSGVCKVILGGEVLTSSQVRILKGLNPQMEIYNEYGPTEATVGSMVKQVKEESDTATIGVPIANMRIYILDDEHQVQGHGIYGQIGISGLGVGSGYLNSPDLTAKKFIKDPFEAGSTLYLTGDIGCWTRGGEVRFAGRKDDQVKIRGHRIELGEIENVLNKHEDIEQAVVLCQETSKGETNLVGYYSGESELATADVRNFLKQHLPDYMHPAQLMYVSSFPLTSNGKIDRRALPHLFEYYATGPASAHVEKPGNEIEAKLLIIFEEVLQRQNIDIHDSFFNIGGHSLNAITLASLINKAYPGAITIALIFVHDSIHQISSLIEKKLYIHSPELKLKSRKDFQDVEF
jgi:amino acid adenylation domain-containing protein